MIEDLLRYDGYWYVATPYSKYPEGIEEAYREACRAAGYLVEHGVKVFSPIAHTHPVAIHGKIDPMDHSIWLPQDAPLMSGACGIIVVKMVTWQDSYGISVEIQEFQEAGKPVFYMDWDEGEKGSVSR